MKTEDLKKWLKDLPEDAQTDAIKAIMAENGKDIKVAQDKLDVAEADNKNLADKLKTTEDAIAKFDGVDVGKLNEEINTLKADLKQKDDDHAAEMEKRDYALAVDKYFNNLGDDYQFSGTLAKDAAKAKFIEKGFKLEDDKFLGADDFIKELKESDAGSFKSTEPHKRGVSSTKGIQSKSEDDKPVSLHDAIAAKLGGGKE